MVAFCWSKCVAQWGLRVFSISRTCKASGQPSRLSAKSFASLKRSVRPRNATARSTSTCSSPWTAAKRQRSKLLIRSLFHSHIANQFCNSLRLFTSPSGTTQRSCSRGWRRSTAARRSWRRSWRPRLWLTWRSTRKWTAWNRIWCSWGGSEISTFCN